MGLPLIRFSCVDVVLGVNFDVPVGVDVGVMVFLVIVLLLAQPEQALFVLFLDVEFFALFGNALEVFYIFSFLAFACVLLD